MYYLAITLKHDRDISLENTKKYYQKVINIHKTMLFLLIV